MALQIRRGTSTELLPNVGTGYTGIRLALGELVYTTDTQKLYIGDGSTYGGIDLLANMSGAVTSVNGQDGAVALTTDEIPEGDALYYTAPRAVDAVATELTSNNSLHDGINFTWAAGNLTATVTGDVITKVQKDIVPKLGGDLVLNTSLATTAASASGGTATITFSAQSIAPFVVGERIYITGVTPNEFNGGPYTVLTCSTTQVTFSKVGTLGPQTVAGTVYTNHAIAGSGTIDLTGNILGSGDYQRTGDILLTGDVSAVKVSAPNVVANVISSTNSPDLLMLKHITSGNPTKLEVAVSKGTVSSPTNTAVGDYLGSFKVSGYYSGEYKFASNIITKWDADADLTKTFPNSSILFVTGDNTDVQSSVTATLDSKGKFTASALQVSDGTVADPSITFTTDGGLDTGFSHPADGVIVVSSNAVEVARFDGGGIRSTGFIKVAQVNGTLPSPPEAGMIVLDGTTFKGYNGSAWVALN